MTRRPDITIPSLITVPWPATYVSSTDGIGKGSLYRLTDVSADAQLEETVQLLRETARERDRYLAALKTLIDHRAITTAEAAEEDSALRDTLNFISSQRCR